MPGDEITADLRNAPPGVDAVASEQMLAEVERRLFGSDAPPVQVGRYQMEERLGEGGMGVVYAARDPELDRRIAIKFYRTGGPGAQLDERQRLRQEARALAAFSHPNVVHMYDVGEHGGELYLVMELVEGDDLSTWLRRKPRGWRDVLDVILDAGRGLEAAHARGILHRDIKPANILVGRDGRARVADFGLASVPARELEAQGGLVMGSPAYMAPEQHAGEPIDARADQYALCVTLFEGVYGTRPFDKQPDVTRLGEAKRSGEFVSVSRKGIPRTLRAIIMRGLSPNPDDRFPDLGQLLSALRKVKAGPRWALIAAATATAAAVAVGVWSFGSARPRPCEGASERLAGVWNDAQRTALQSRFLGTQSSYAAQTWSLVEDGLDARASEWTRAYVDACEATHVRGDQSEAWLDLRMQCLEENLDELRGLVGVFALADTDVLQHATAAVQELRPLTACYDPQALEKSASVPTDPNARQEVGRVRAQLARARALRWAGQYQEGLALVQTLEQAVQDVGFDPLLGELALERGRARWKLADYEAAREDLGAAYWSAAAAGHDRIAAEAATSRSCVECMVLGEGEAGFQWAQHAEVAMHRFEPDAELEARRITCGGVCLARLGRAKEAEPLFHKALDILAAAGEDGTPLLQPLTSLGILAGIQEDGEAARGYHERALKIAENVHGDLHPTVAHLRCNFASSLLSQGELERSGQLFERCLKESQAALGSNHAQVARARSGLGAVAVAQGKPRIARAHFTEALAIQEAVLGKSHPDLIDILVGLGNAALRLDDTQEARKQYARALEIAETSPLDPSQPEKLRERLRLLPAAPGQD